MTHNKIMGQKVLRKHREEENKTTTQKNHQTNQQKLASIPMTMFVI